MLEQIKYFFVDLPLLIIVYFNVGLMNIELFSVSLAFVLPVLYILSKLYQEVEIFPKPSLLKLYFKVNFLAILSFITDLFLERILVLRYVLGRFLGPLIQFIAVVPIIYGVLMRLVILKQIYQNLYYLTKPFFLLGLNSYISVFKQTNEYCFSLYRYFIPVKQNQKQEFDEYVSEEYTDSVEAYEEQADQSSIN